MTYRISLERNTLRFAAAHFTVLGGDCEPLHGHNYAVMVEIEGALTPASWVIDFAEVRRLAAGICKEVDHRFILPTTNPALSISKGGGAYEIGYNGRRYVIPEQDVAPLPIDNSTAERLAEWFAGRLGAEIRARGATNVTRISAGIEEAPGQAGWYSMDLARSP